MGQHCLCFGCAHEAVVPPMVVGRQRWPIDVSGSALLLAVCTSQMRQKDNSMDMSRCTPAWPVFGVSQAERQAGVS